MDYKILDKYIIIKENSKIVSFTNSLLINDLIILPQMVDNFKDYDYYIYENENNLIKIFFEKTINVLEFNNNMIKFDFTPFNFLIFKAGLMDFMNYYTIDNNYILKENSLDLITSNFAYLNQILFKRQLIKVYISNVIEEEKFVIFNYYQNLKENNFSIVKDRYNNIIRYVIITYKTSNLYLGVNINYLINKLFNLSIPCFKWISKNNIFEFYQKRIVLINFLNYSICGIYLKNGYILTNFYSINNEYNKKLDIKFDNGLVFKAIIYKKYRDYFNISILKIEKNDHIHLKNLDNLFNLYYDKFFKIPKYYKNAYIWSYNKNDNKLIKSLSIYKVENIKNTNNNNNKNYFIISNGIVFNGNLGSPLISKYGEFLGLVFYKFNLYNNIIPYILSINFESLTNLFKEIYLNKNPENNLFGNLDKDFVKESIYFLKSEKGIPKL